MGRPREQDDFPPGFGLCAASPFTLKLQCNRFNEMPAEYESMKIN